MSLMLPMNQKSQILLKEIRQALKIVWFIYSLLGIMVIFISTSFSEGTVLNITPTCFSVKYFNSECHFCGMTRAFINIGKLNFFEALKLNKGSIFLFIVILANSLLFIKHATFNLTKYFIKNQFIKTNF